MASAQPTPPPPPSEAPAAAPAATLAPLAPSGAAEGEPSEPADEPTPPAVADGRDRVSLGGGVLVRRGERVRDAVAMGGDLVVAGEVEGSAVAMGGDLVVRSGAVVHGDATAMGGDLVVEPGGRVDGARVEMGGAAGGSVTSPAGATAPGPMSWFDRAWSWASDVLDSAARWALLFVLGLLLLGLAPDRLAALQRTMLRAPLPSLATGVVVAVAAAGATLVLAVTLIGIPAAIVLALLLACAAYVGLAASATVAGAALPIRPLRGRPVLQLAAGVAALFVASWVPVVGDLIVAGAVLYGLGALWKTRFSRGSPVDPVPDAGPYRTGAMSAEAE